MARDPRVHGRLAIELDVVGATDDGVHHPVINRPGREHRRHRRQFVAQHPGQMNLIADAAAADVQRRGHLGGHLQERIDPPPPALDQLHRAAGIQLTDERQPPGHRRRLGARSRTDPVDQPRIRHIIEHTFDPTPTR